MTLELTYYMSTRKNGLFIIENKIIGQAEIQKIADLIWKEYQPRHIRAINNSFRAYVKCFEKVSYEDDGIKIFNDDSEIYRERIKTIEITAQCDKSLYVKLRLNHGQVKIEENYISDSDIEIGGDNFEKIHDIHARISQYIKSIPEQHNLFVKTYGIISKLFFLLGALTFGFIIDLFNNNSKNYTPYWRTAISDIGSFIGYGFLASLFGGLLVFSLYDMFVKKSRDFWPIVELQIGPEHFRPEVKQRKYVIEFIVCFVVPLGGALFYDIMKIVFYLQE